MIQNLLTIRRSVQQYNESVRTENSFSKGQIQKIYSTAHMICMNVRYPGKTVVLYIGRGGGYEGIWLSSQVPPSKFRIRDHFLEYLRKHVRGSYLSTIECDSFDRIIRIDYKNSSGDCSCYFFWRGRTLYFTNVTTHSAGRLSIFNAWDRGGDIVEAKIPLTFQDVYKDVGRQELDISKMEVQDKLLSLESYFEKIEEMTSKVIINSRKKKRLIRKVENIEKDLLKVSKWVKINEFINSYNYEDELPIELKVDGVLFKFRRKWNNHQKIDFLYKKIKAFKKAELLLKDRIIPAKEHLEEYRAGKVEEYKQLKVVLPLWAKNSKNNNAINSIVDENELNFEEFSFCGVKCAVGKDSRSNDYLRNTWAKKDDTWFHIDGEIGAHLIVKEIENVNLQELFTLFGAILRDFSKLTTREINMVYTKVKYLKGVKGTKGKVTYKKAKYIKVLYEQNWKKIVFTSQLSGYN